jgi:ATP-dependent helicase/nuclease subunit A
VDTTCCFEGDDCDRWDIRLWDREEVLRKTKVEECNEQESESEAALAAVEDAQNARDEIIKRLEWKYPYSAYEKLPVKITVTELKQHFNIEAADEYHIQAAPSINRRPGFLEEATEMNAAEKGSLLHFVLQHMNFGEELSEAGIRKQLEAMVTAELLTEVQSQNVNIHKLVSFIKSPLGRRVIEAKRLYREMPFTMEVDCTEVFGSLEGCTHVGETIVLQGIIDCYFEEEGKLVLVDYKTDYIPQGKTDEIKEKYRTQIEYYARALEQITGKEIAGKYIYLFWNGEVLEY